MPKAKAHQSIPNDTLLENHHLALSVIFFVCYTIKIIAGGDTKYL